MSNERSRDWVFTVNNPTVEHMKQLKALSEEVSYLVYQIELSSTGTKHIQGFCQFANARSFKTMQRKITGAHLEKRRGTPQEAADYCKDPDKRHPEVPDYIEIGNITVSKVSAKMEDVKACIDTGMSPMEVIDENPSLLLSLNRLKQYQVEKKAIESKGKLRDSLIVVYLQGDTGHGKSYMAFKGYPEAYRVTDRSNPWDAYNYEDTVIFDDWTHSDYTITEMLNWLDIYPVQLRARYASPWADYTLVIITTNLKLSEIYTNANERHVDAFKRRIHISAEVKDRQIYYNGEHFKSISELVLSYSRIQVPIDQYF